MARARNLKPSFFRDARVVACSFPARLLFEGLWCLADHKGRLKNVPVEIKMEIFPADDVDVQACMQELADQELITMYHDCSGTALVQVNNFSKHQNPHRNEKQDRNGNEIAALPGPDDIEEKEEPTDQEVSDALRVLHERYGSDPASSPFPLPPSGSRNPESGDAGAGAPEEPENPDPPDPPPKEPKLPPCPPNVSESVWAAYVDHRKAKKAKLTDHAVKLLTKKLADLSQQQADRCLELSIENGWTGVFPEQIQRSGGHRSGSGPPGGEKNYREGIAADGSF